MMLSERRQPPITHFQPIVETIGEPFTMSKSASTPTPKYHIRIRQQPSGPMGVGHIFPTPLIIESNPDDNLIFMAILSDVDGKPYEANVVKLSGNTAGNGDGGESNNGDGGDSKRKRSSSSTQAQVELTTFGDIAVPTKGRFTIMVQAQKNIDGKKWELVGVLKTNEFDVV